jgi:thiosulfate dehydrogenase [quinone] large subunit
MAIAGGRQGTFRGIPDAAVGYAFMRFVLGFDILMHGISRVGAVGAFADGMVKAFQSTILPPSLVRFFALALPFIEMVVGLPVLLGLFTRAFLLAGGMLIAALMFGTALQGKWDVLTQQLIYAALYAALLANAQWNRLALDSWLTRRRSNLK